MAAAGGACEGCQMKELHIKLSSIKFLDAWLWASCTMSLAKFNQPSAVLTSRCIGSGHCVNEMAASMRFQLPEP